MPPYKSRHLRKYQPYCYILKNMQIEMYLNTKYSKESFIAYCKCFGYGKNSASEKLFKRIFILSKHDNFRKSEKNKESKKT